MVSVKEYAKSRGVTIQAVHQQMSRKRNSEKLVGHVQIIEGVKYLDEEATAILDESRKKTPVVIIDDQKDQLIQELKDNLKRKEDYIAILEAAAIVKQEQITTLEEKQLQIEQKKQEEIDTAVKAAVKEKSEEYKEQVADLQEEHKKMLEEQGIVHEQAIESLKKSHEAELEAERSRKLTVGEAIRRIFGK